jgi:hypothetical protein
MDCGTPETLCGTFPSLRCLVVETRFFFLIEGGEQTFGVAAPDMFHRLFGKLRERGERALVLMP